MKRQVRNSKYEPLVDEVDLLHAHPPALGNANDYNIKSYPMKINEQNDTVVVNSNDNSNIPPEKITLPFTSPDPTLIPNDPAVPESQVFIQRSSRQARQPNQLDL